MNDRMYELINQCFIGTTDGKFSSLNTVANVEKFAELIVRECISTLENAENGYRDYRNQIEDGMRDHCIGLIKHKFGVEDHEEDSACPLCGEDGGTTCGIPGCQY